ncbi:MAG TPA: PQQ-binding-like beta-propeller repeat protein [Pyrinomonadaceae bacterium]
MTQRREGEAAGAARRPSSDGAMQGVDLRHTRLFRTRAAREAKSLERLSQKLFKCAKDGLGIEVLAYGLSFGEWYSSVGPHFTLPVVAGDALYFTVSSGADGYVFALDKKTGAGRWRGKADRTAFSPPAVAGGAVYLATQAGAYFALGARTGEERWKLWHAPLVTSAPLISDGVIYVLRSDGYVYALR